QRRHEPRRGVLRDAIRLGELKENIERTMPQTSVSATLSGRRPGSEQSDLIIPRRPHFDFARIAPVEPVADWRESIKRNGHGSRPISWHQSARKKDSNESRETTNGAVPPLPAIEIGRSAPAQSAMCANLG
ncbi:MAG: hypothetical protein WD070_01395, partial [Pirellulaceae bacterium]